MHFTIIQKININAFKFWVVMGQNVIRLKNYKYFFKALYVKKIKEEEKKRFCVLNDFTTERNNAFMMSSFFQENNIGQIIC